MRATGRPAAEGGRAAVAGGVAARAGPLTRRTFSYSDTQRYRVGRNYLRLPVNKPSG